MVDQVSALLKQKHPHQYICIIYIQREICIYPSSYIQYGIIPMGIHPTRPRAGSAADGTGGAWGRVGGGVKPIVVLPTSMVYVTTEKCIHML